MLCSVLLYDAFASFLHFDVLSVVCYAMWCYPRGHGAFTQAPFRAYVSLHKSHLNLNLPQCKCTMVIALEEKRRGESKSCV